LYAQPSGSSIKQLLAIDDFGTGYSSLAYLKHFPLNVLKIDKSFIDDLPYSKDDKEITATIIAMEHILGFQVLAEGVEKLEQLAFLKVCHYLPQTLLIYWKHNRLRLSLGAFC